ncbi:hypothetical protein BC940DRAFT_304760 [Gongronella butleri]|nr:hypothetical protein BC940DRAFT_304760 [Gongronella butleri]
MMFRWYSMAKKRKKRLVGSLMSTIFYRTSVSDDAKGTALRPDASVNIVHGMHLGQRIGCGEVKRSYQAKNTKLINTDIIRIAHFAKKVVDENTVKAAG